MSIPLMCGAASASLTVPVIVPSSAALTFGSRINAAQPRRTTVNSNAEILKRFVIETLSLEKLITFGITALPAKPESRA
jgi:hypothetical protein